MKPIGFSIYGPPDVLQPKEVEKPRQKGNEIVIHVHATSLTTRTRWFE
jgi:NADPH:quinone reductase-like Zn-dependent oxidoreductase